ncbi:MAG: DNA-binding transcriptional regulator [Verrucomicrobiota bacterium]
MKERSARVRSASVARLRHGGLHHARHSVLLLLGYYNVRLHTGIVRYAHEADWVLNDAYVRIGLPPVWWRGDGILALISHPKDVVALRELPRLPLVDLSKGWISDSMPAKYRASGIGRPRVYYDNALIGRLAAEHFLERGFKHVAYMNCGNYWMEVERMPAFRQTIEAAGSRYYEIPYYKCFPRTSPRPLRDHQRAHQWLMKAVRELPKPVGIAASVDDVATRLLHACGDAGVSVPEEVAVLGCDNDPMVCDCALVPLSSVDIDWERVGYEGAKLLDQIMDGKRAPRRPILIPPKGVVTRLSTNILAVPDINIARAVRFIWDHYAEVIGTHEVAAAAGLSRRTLERGFRIHLGQSVNNEITQVRIERAKKLLLETNLKAHEVAQVCGFSGIVHFSKAFHRLTGTRPSHYRRQQATTSPSGEQPQ